MAESSGRVKWQLFLAKWQSQVLIRVESKWQSFSAKWQSQVLIRVESKWQSFLAKWQSFYRVFD